ncbi:hypothetical protein DUI87_27987 [Hirundo rustica rustica]|uniref:Topoisomerase 6 subunit A/Spo11 TOPRIM domain-containing protein n=1 Tax=Hirundo rustica rustica TaxID=333673 RepID=A0A3M0JAF4_HIRRU|nr:hypothetical protein DUI87_27987 [Hirundo rustica rustica]
MSPALMLKILSMIYRMVQSNTYATKRSALEAKNPGHSERMAFLSQKIEFWQQEKTSQNWFKEGRGIPDLNTRLLVRKLWDSFQIPVFTLMDADPHGVEIMCVYKYGSVSMSFEAHHLTVPSVKWLGLLPSDLERLNICKDALIPFTKQDENKLASILKRPYVACQPLWKKELEIMAASKLKAEIQVLTSLSSDYLSRVYLPNKLHFGGWL